LQLAAGQAFAQFHRALAQLWIGHFRDLRLQRVHLLDDPVISLEQPLVAAAEIPWSTEC
jgi:ABC-type hemin transport system ATPase subunit